MKKTRNRLIGVLLLLCLLLSGCGSWKNYFHTEESLKREAAKALKEKYDEEFVIHDAWPRSQTIFYVTCSPKNDMEVVFEAEVYKDGRGVYQDEYLQGVLANQVRDRIQLKLQEVFEDCYVKVTFTFVNPKFDYYEGVTIEEYYEMYEEDVSFYLQIFVNREKLYYSLDEAEEEFDYLSNLLTGEVMRDAGCRCYFVDEATLNEWKKYFQKFSREMGANDSGKEDIYFGFGFNDGIINKTFDEYKKIRMETETNE